MFADGSGATRRVGGDRPVQDRLTSSGRGVGGRRYGVGPEGGTAGRHQGEENSKENSSRSAP